MVDTVILGYSLRALHTLGEDINIPAVLEGIHPHRISHVWNVVTPMESELVLELMLWHLSKSTVRKT